MTTNQLSQKIYVLEKKIEELKLLLLKKKSMQSSFSLEGFLGKKEITDKDINAAKKSLFKET